jgi:hypothetical protein
MLNKQPFLIDQLSYLQSGEQDKLQISKRNPIVSVLVTHPKIALVTTYWLTVNWDPFMLSAPVYRYRTIIFILRQDASFVIVFMRSRHNL